MCNSPNKKTLLVSLANDKKMDKKNREKMIISQNHKLFIINNKI